MSETLEQRIRRHAAEDDPGFMFSTYASDIVELLDDRDATIAAMREAIAAAREYFSLTQNDILNVMDPTIKQYDAAQRLRDALSKLGEPT